MAEPTAEVLSARDRCAQLAIDGVRRRAEAAQLRQELGVIADGVVPTEEPALTPLVAGAKARAVKTSAYAEVISSEPKPAAHALPVTARVASLRKALPAPAWSWVPLSHGPRLVGCGDPAKLVELSMVRMGEGAEVSRDYVGGAIEAAAELAAAAFSSVAMTADRKALLAEQCSRPDACS